MITIKGKTPDEKIAHIEKILNRMSRKLHKTVVGVIPPIPVMFQVEEPNANGEILSVLLPAAGTIKDVAVFVREFKDKDPVTFKASIDGLVFGTSAAISTRKNLTIQTLNLAVSAGDRLRLVVEGEDKVSGIWIAFLYQIGITSSEQKKFLISEFIQITDGEKEEINGSEE